MAGKGFDIWDKLSLSRACADAAHSAFERNDETPVSALIRPNLQQPRRDDPVKPRPVKTVIGMVDFAGHGRHQRDRVVLTFGQGGDGFRQFEIIRHNFPLILIHPTPCVNSFSILLDQDQGERTHLGQIMQLNSELHGQDIIVIVAAPRIDAVQAIEFKEKFRNLVVGSEGRVVMDLSAVTFVDSSGLGAIVASMKALGGARKLELCGLQGNVEKVFRLTRLDSVFRVHASAAAARTSMDGYDTTSLAG